MTNVWVVTRWVWGGGGDDEREIIGVCDTENGAIRLKYEIDNARVVLADGGGYEACDCEISLHEVRS